MKDAIREKAQRVEEFQVKDKIDLKETYEIDESEMQLVDVMVGSCCCSAGRQIG